MTIPNSVEGFTYEAKYWLEFADTLIRRLAIMIAVWFALMVMSLAWNLKGLPGHSLAPFLAFVPSFVLTIVAVYLSVRLANLLTAALLLIPWVRRKAEKLVAFFAGIYIATFLIGLLIALHFWDIPSPGRFALIALAIPIAILGVLAVTVRARWVTPILVAAGTTILLLLIFANGKFEWPDVWNRFGSQHSQAATVQPKADTSAQPSQEQGRAPALTSPARPPESGSPETEEVYNRDSYLFDTDGRVFEFDRSAYPYREFALTFPVGKWVAVKIPNTHLTALPATGKPCTRAYFRAVRNNQPTGEPVERNWCDQDRADDINFASTFLVQAVQPDETIEFTNDQINVRDEPTAFVPAANRTVAPTVSPFFPGTVILKGIPALPCTDEIRHMNSSGKAKTAKVNFGITVDGIVKGVAIIETTGIPALDDKVKAFILNYKLDTTSVDGPELPVPLAEAEIHIPGNCHE